MQDQAILSNLKLWTEDDDIRDGTTVTKELIDELSKGGLNPTWYANAEWIDGEYGSKPERPEVADDVAGERAGESKEFEQSVPTEKTYSSEYVALLQERITDLKDDKRSLLDQLDRFDETLNSNTQLQQQLHVLLKDMQDRLLPAPKEPYTPTTSPIVHAQEAQSPAPVETPKTNTAAPKKKRKSKAKTKNSTPGFFSFQTPTLHKVARKLSRRSS